MSEQLDLVISYVLPIWGAFALLTMIAVSVFMFCAAWVLMFKGIRNRIRDGYWS